FDSHSDTWDDYWGQKYTHGTPFRRAVDEGLIDPSHSVQLGMRGPTYDADDLQVAIDLGFALVTTPELRAYTPTGVGALVRQRTAGMPVFLSFDIDFLDPVAAPGTGTPEVGGWFTHEAQAFLRALIGINIVAADVVEVLPQLDHAEVTSLAAASMAYEIISLLARRKAGLAEA
ncbi:Ureohydrolase, partial [mine drainage metagenome]